MLLQDIPEGEDTECENTEDLISTFEETNSIELNRNHIIRSMDVNALYPSLDIKHTIDRVCQVYKEKSTVAVNAINFDEVGLYIVLAGEEDDINGFELKDKLPKKISPRGRKPNITGNGMEEDKTKRYRPWDMPDASRLNDGEKRHLLTFALKIALTFVMTNHIRDGGAIGLELTGLLARIYMIWWDKRFLEKCAIVNIIPDIYKRYVDDINSLTEFIGNGYVYNGTTLIKDQDKELSDSNESPDKVMMQLLNDIANSIHPSIQLTNDYPSKYNDKKIPILNLKVWTKTDNEEGTKIVYEHYRKEVATRSTVHAKSAMDIKQKRTILTQELLTIMTNCSSRLDEQTRNGHINDFMKRIQFSGYNKEMRYDVYNSAKKAFEKMKNAARDGTRPIHRPKNWKRAERREAKETKKRTWYKSNGAESVIFVPCTPNAQLKRRYTEVIRKTNFMIKVVEKSGTKLKDILHKKDPFRRNTCGREDCFVCTSGGKGSLICDRENITYRITCNEKCGEKDIYKGESSYCAYTRGLEHLAKFAHRDKDSILHKHCEIHHGGRQVEFTMDIIGTFHRDSMKRQIREGIEIEMTNPKRLMNTRAEWNPSLIPQCSIQRR